MVYGLWFMVYGLWFMVYGLWFMVYGLGFRVQGLGYSACARQRVRAREDSMVDVEFDQFTHDPPDAPPYLLSVFGLSTSVFGVWYFGHRISDSFSFFPGCLLGFARGSFSFSPELIPGLFWGCFGFHFRFYYDLLSRIYFGFISGFLHSPARTAGRCRTADSRPTSPDEWHLPVN